MRINGLLAGVFVCGLVACAPEQKTPVAVTVPAAEPATQPAVHYADEVYRVVGNDREIVSVLKNGLTVIIRRISSPVVSVQAWVRTGSLYEGQWLGGGLSHLLEHLVAGGSTAVRTEAEAQNLLQQIGDNSDAYTDYDHTVFFVNSTNDHLDVAADLVTSWIFTAKITPDEYARERQVVQRELEKDLGEADWAFYQLTVYNRYLIHPMRIPVVGYQAVIQGLSRDEVYRYYQSAYVPQNVVFGVAGDLDPEVMLAAIRKRVDGVPPGRVPNKLIAEDVPVPEPRKVVATFPKLGQAKLELGFPSVKQTDPDMYPLDLLSAIMGQGDSSMLVEELRDRQNLVSRIGASDNTPMVVGGTFAIDMDLDADKIPQATDAVLAMVEKVRKDLIDEDRINRAKAILRSAEAMGLQTAEDNVQAMIDNYLSTGTPEATYARRISEVTAEQIRAAANKYLDPSKLLTTALVPEEALPAGGRARPKLAAAQDLLRGGGSATRPAEQAASSEVSRQVLDNGTVLLLKRTAGAPVVSVQLLSLGGLSAEDAKTNGLGNLAMRMVPRGTTERNARQIAEFFDSIGAAVQTSCGNNSWSWSTTCLQADLASTMEVMGDLAAHATFPDEELGPTRQLILADIAEQDHDWFSAGRRYFNSVYFGPRHEPYQFAVIGSPENVQGFTVQQVRQWYAQKVLAAPRVLAIYGDIDLTAARDLAMRHFGALPAVTPAPRRAPAFTHYHSLSGLPDGISGGDMQVSDVHVEKTDNSEAAVFIGFDSGSVEGDPDTPALVLANTLCAGYGYPTGYIFESLRGKGLVYDANASNFWGLNAKMPGVFWAYGACDPKNVNEVAEGILLNVARLQDDADPQWFDRAKSLILTTDAMNHETAADQASVAAIDELVGLGYDFQDKLGTEIKQVTIPEVRWIAGHRLSQCVVTVMTSAPELVNVPKGMRRYPSFPPVELTPQGIQHDVGGK